MALSANARYPPLPAGRSRGQVGALEKQVTTSRFRQTQNLPPPVRGEATQALVSIATRTGCLGFHPTGAAWGLGGSLVPTGASANTKGPGNAPRAPGAMSDEED